jgi:hypothetical protein
VAPPELTLNAFAALQGPTPAEFFVWIHQVCAPAASVCAGVTEQLVALQTAAAEYQSFSTFPEGPSTQR